MRVYAVPVERVRLESTPASGQHGVSEDGLFQFGHSKEHRPDLPPVQGMLSALDPLGRPVATEVRPGDRAAEPWDRPALERVRASLGRRGLLDVGDAKLAALEPRAPVQAGGDADRCPLTAHQVTTEPLDALLGPVWAEQQPLEPITRTQPDGPALVLAPGCEQTVTQLAPTPEGTTLTDGDQATPLTWTERRLVGRRQRQAELGAATLRARLAQAQAAILALHERAHGKPRPRARSSLHQAGAAIVRRCPVANRLQVTSHEQVPERPLRRDRDRPAGRQREDEVSVSVAVDDHGTGWLRLRSIAVRLWTLVQDVVRQPLAARDTTLAGRSVGTPTRSTARPTTEALVAAFTQLTRTSITTPGSRLFHLSTLSPLQRQILDLLPCPPDLYTRLSGLARQPPLKMSER